MVSSFATGATFAQHGQDAPPSAGKSEPAPEIFEAAYSGNLKRATELASQNPWIAKLRSTDGRTPLHFAVAGGQTDMIFFLTTQGADLSAGPESPLLAAIDYPDHAKAAEMAEVLLMNASDPNARGKDGRTALQAATARGYTDIANLLIHRGADFTGTPNVERAYFGSRYAYDAQGGPFTFPNIDGLPQDFINRFVTLAHFDSERTMHLFKLAPALLSARASWDELAIEAAAHMGRVPLAQFFADEGAPVSACTATLLGLRERVESLVGANSSCLRERGAHDLPLLTYTAFGEQRAGLAEFLLKSGADVHAVGLGMTPLHVAAAKGHVELAQLLIDYGADINAPGRQQGALMTPLDMAVRSRQTKMEQFLKDRGGRA